MQRLGRCRGSQRLLAGFWIGPWLWTLTEAPLEPPRAPEASEAVAAAGWLAVRGEGGAFRDPTAEEAAAVLAAAGRRRIGLREGLVERQGTTEAGGVRVDLPADLGSWLVAARDALGRVVVECAEPEPSEPAAPVEEP